MKLQRQDHIEGMPFMYETDKPCPICQAHLWFNTISRFYICTVDRFHWYSPYLNEADREQDRVEQDTQEFKRHRRHRKPNLNCRFCS